MFRIRGPVKPRAYRLLGHTATTRGGSRWHAGGCGQRIRLTHLCARMATFLINSWIFMLNRSSKPYVLPLPTRCKNVKVVHTRLPSVGFRRWSRFLAVSLQVTWVINPAVGCHYFLSRLQLPPQPLRGLLPVLLLGELRHDGCEQFA